MLWLMLSGEMFAPISVMESARRRLRFDKPASEGILHHALVGVRVLGPVRYKVGLLGGSRLWLNWWLASRVDQGNIRSILLWVVQLVVSQHKVAASVCLEHYSGMCT